MKAKWDGTKSEYDQDHSWLEQSSFFKNSIYKFFSDCKVLAHRSMSHSDCNDCEKRLIYLSNCSVRAPSLCFFISRSYFAVSFVFAISFVYLIWELWRIHKMKCFWKSVCFSWKSGYTKPSTKLYAICGYFLSITQCIRWTRISISWLSVSSCVA